MTRNTCRGAMRRLNAALLQHRAAAGTGWEHPAFGLLNVYAGEVQAFTADESSCWKNGQ